MDKYSLPKGWVEACSKSHNKFLSGSMFKGDIKDRCSESDGAPCRFLRAVGSFNYIAGYVCLFSKCIKRYPTEEDLMEIEKCHVNT